MDKSKRFLPLNFLKMPVRDIQIFRLPGSGRRNIDKAGMIEAIARAEQGIGWLADSPQDRHCHQRDINGTTGYSHLLYPPFVWCLTVSLYADRIAYRHQPFVQNRRVEGIVCSSKISGRLELKKSWLPKCTRDETYPRMVDDILEEKWLPGTDSNRRPSD